MLISIAWACLICLVGISVPLCRISYESHAIIFIAVSFGTTKHKNLYSMRNTTPVKKIKKSSDKIVYVFTFLVQISVKHLPLLTRKVVNNYIIKTNISILWTMFSNLFNKIKTHYIFVNKVTQNKTLLQGINSEKKTKTYNSKRLITINQN